MKKSKVAALAIGTILGVGLIAGGFLFMQTFSRASSDKPVEVAITDLTASSAKVSWKTGNDTVGTIISYGTSVDLATPLVQPSEPTLSKEHSAVITGLSASTTYYFVLGSEKEFNNAGVPWSFTTKSENDTTSELFASPTPTVAISGTVEPTEVPINNRINTCKETNCEAIKAKLGTECSTQEYMKCIKAAQNPSPTN